MTRIPVNGIHLNVEVEGAGPALMLLHGFTGDVSTWEALLPAFRGFRTIRVDLIGHGASDAPEDPERYSMAHAVEDLVALLDHLDIGQTAVLGYSLGGRVALHFALEAQERLWALILESSSPGIADAAERAARAASDNALADDLLRDGIEAFVDRWQSQALFASQLKLPAEIQEKQRRLRLSQKPLGLANSLRGMGAGRQEYLMPRLGELKIPTFLMAGELDTKYSQLAYEMAALVPDTAVVVTPDAGHAVHLELPERFQRLAGTYLNLLLGDEMDVQHLDNLHGGAPRLDSAPERPALGEA